MSKYRVKERSFIDGKLYEPGEIVEFSGKAGKNLIPHNDGDVVLKEDEPPTNEELQELDQLRTIYEEMFGDAPHKNTSAKTLKEKIDAKRKELGV
ncbi:TPA: hypothetical protein N2N62_000701 [Citrobacter freundii]|uniref:hypothetical protein n=1 Tax=Citrobacter freundii TaxID=546 RepID=UPI0015EA6B82|nr:hypothetical protein [Citrobacter freundii]EKX7348923.1 hypothetical protein [Citrobacter freundii]QLS14117.1 hypothetical protein HV325_06840 [Citrobacter freundii]WIJ96182.1 hypothetical protein OI904_09350 [Citrobacter freundii]HCL5679124.1 hypothetical protein [Citrobacter freundii]HCL6561996.1 hypothetical protein [Citrobacter freundii]